MPSPSAKPLGPSFRWIALAVMSFTCFAQYYIYDSITPLGTLLKTQLGFTGSQYGLLFSAYSVANVFLAMIILGGLLVDKLGIKVSGLLYAGICVLGAAVTALGAFSDLPRLLGGLYPWLATAFAPDWSPELKVMLFGRMLFGVGAESILLVNNKVLARWFAGKELSFAYGLNLTIMRLGTFLALSLQADLAAKLGLGPALLFALGVMALGFIGFVAYLALERLAAGRPGAPRIPIVAAASLDPSERFELRQAFSFSPSFWVISLLCVAFYSAIFPFQSYAPDILVQRFAYTPETAGKIAGSLVIGAMIGTPLFGLLIDRYGKRASLMILGSLLLIPCHLLLGLTHFPPILLIFFVGIAFSLVPAALWASIPLMVPSNRLGTAFGVIGYIQNVGLMLFPWVAGLIADRHTTRTIVDGVEVAQVDYTWTMLMFAALGFLGLVAAIIFKWVDKRAGSPLERPSGALRPEDNSDGARSSAC